MIENIEYSKDWLLARLIEVDFKSKQEKKERIIAIKEKDLYKMILEFIKLNERGE